MEVQELRIGNYVRIFDTITQIEGMSTWDNLIQNSNFAERELSEFEPIQLTKQWLQKFGFSPASAWDDFKYFNKDGINIYLCNDSKEQWFEYEMEIKIESVHHLQNIHYALTQKELKLNQ